MSPRKDFDVIVVGARCAGAAHARLLALAGFRVLMVDRAEPGTDTLSSHSLTRGGVLQLSRWGLLPQIMASGTPAIARSIFRFGPLERPIDIRPVADGPGMIAPRRHKLDAMLADAAQAAGVEVLYSTRLTGALRDDAGRVCGAELCGADGQVRHVTAEMVVGADGLQSTVAKAVGAQSTALAAGCLAHIYGYYALPDQDDNLFAFAPGLSVGLTPTDEGQTTVIATAEPARLRAEMRQHGAEGALVRLSSDVDPFLGEKMRASGTAERVRIFGGHVSVRRTSAGPGWALIGDAGQFRDPVTAHGMTDAFRDAEHLARHLTETGFDATGYERERNAASGAIFALTAEMADYSRPLVQLADRFMLLSKLMRKEQEWMDVRFGPVTRAA